MAVQPYTLLVDNVRMKIVQWTLTNGDTGQWYPWSGLYPEKFFQVYGTWGTGGTVIPEGTNEGYPGAVTNDLPTVTPAAPVQLRDSTHSLMSFAANGGDTLLQNPAQIRPHCTAGDGTTSLTVLLLLTINMRH
jgi:hypothetical protein